MSSERWLVYKAAAFEIKQCADGPGTATAPEFGPGTFAAEDS
jgi:hypothetical protein